MGNSTLLADYLKQNYPIEQIKYNMYVEEDIYYRIPVLVFRFSFNTKKEVYDEFKRCIESFKGNLNWTLFQSFYGKKVKNYLMCPLEVYKMQKDTYERNIIISEKDYFEEKYNYLCEMGVSDIPSLSNYIKDNFIPDKKV